MGDDERLVSPLSPSFNLEIFILRHHSQLIGNMHFKLVINTLVNEYQALVAEQVRHRSVDGFVVKYGYHLVKEAYIIVELMARLLLASPHPR
jgi:hypothetical protein